MSVTYVKGQSPLSTVGGLMSLAGAVIPGAGLLAPLGMATSTLGGSGLTDAQTTMLGKIMDNVMTGEGNDWMKLPSFRKTKSASE